MISSLLASCGGGGSSSPAPSQPAQVTPPAPALPVLMPVLTFNDTVSKSPTSDSLGYEPGNTRHSAGELQTNTGIWGIKSASAYSINMFGSIDPNANRANVSVNWDVTPSTTPGVVIFSNITYGLHPGAASSTTSKLPAQVSGLSDQIVLGDVETSCEVPRPSNPTVSTCEFQTGLDIFVMNSNRTSNNDVGTEIMVFTERTIGPNDTSGETATIGGVTYKMLRNAFATDWNVVQYFAPMERPINSLNLNVKDFVVDALNRGIIKPTDYLVSIEFGSEVISGKGKTEIKNFKIN